MNLTHLKQLGAENIFIIREVAACFEKPSMFYSIDKVSTVMLHLARKAFWPGNVLLNIKDLDKAATVLATACRTLLDPPLTENGLTTT
jgi:3'-phosphoadenosine 5'-phosphosulfate sulfotransferase (PAPS reductase)/FAD synthetase